MIISSLSVAVKNATWTAVTAMPVGLTLAAFPITFSVDAFFWGCVGGLCRSVAIFEGWKAVAASLAVGGFSAAGLNGSKFPWLSDFLTSEVGNPQLQPFFIGVCGIIIIGTFVDIARMARKKFGGQP